VKYRSLMVYLDLGQSNESALRIACDLADRFKSRVIGATAGFPHMPIYLGDTDALDVREADCQQLNKAVAGHEGRFRAALGSVDGLREWRSDAASPADFLTSEARAADLLIVGRRENGIRFIPNQSLDIGDALMRAGRPMLVVPPRKTFLALNRVLIAWKETAEARKAVAAALPLLESAQEVMIVEITSDERENEIASRRAIDVATWLQQYNIAATASAELCAGDVGGYLDAIAVENGADIIVAGAYGHSRLREWAFGGVTRHLLQQGSTCALLMH
jgi:nucleotide-binding universal stress UspA family protein